MALIKPISYWQQAKVGGVTPPPAGQFIYLNGYNFYKWKGTQLGSITLGGVAKIDLTGTLDTTWTTAANPSGQQQVRFATALNGNVYGDTRNSIGNRIKKWDSSGTPVATTVVGNSVWAMSAREGNSFFMISGDRTVSYGGSSINGIGKINEDLTRDTGFTTNVGSGPQGGAAPAAFIYNTHVSADRIGVFGSFNTWNGNSTYQRFVVLNYDGTRDTGFVRSGTFNANVTNGIFIDNKWIVGGLFTTYNGVTVNRIVAFNTDGSVDTTFTTNIGTGFNGDVNGFTKVSDTQIIVVGAFTTLNGVTRNRIALLNTDGTIPTNIFGTGANNTLGYIKLDNAGKIYFSGGAPVTSYNGYTSNNFFALNADGSINSSFVTGSAMQTSTNAVPEAGGLSIF